MDNKAQWSSGFRLRVPPGVSSVAAGERIWKARGGVIVADTLEDKRFLINEAGCIDPDAPRAVKLPGGTPPMRDPIGAAGVVGGNSVLPAPRRAA